VQRELSRRRLGKKREIMRPSHVDVDTRGFPGLQDAFDRRSQAARSAQHGRSSFYESPSARSGSGTPAPALSHANSSQMSLYSEEDVHLAASSGRGLKEYISARSRSPRARRDEHSLGVSAAAGPRASRVQIISTQL
jgi:hypothetical protein